MVEGPPCKTPDTSYAAPLGVSVATMEVRLRKLLERFGLSGNEDVPYSTLAETPVAMVATTKIYTKDSVKTPKIDPKMSELRRLQS